MQETCNNTDVLNIAARSLWEFLQQIQGGVKQGYVLSEDNACFPQAYISLYTVTLVKEDEPVVEIDTTVVEDVTEDFNGFINVPVDEVTTQVKKIDGRKKVK